MLFLGVNVRHNLVRAIERDIDAIAQPELAWEWDGEQGWDAAMYAVSEVIDKWLRLTKTPEKPE